MKNHRNELFRFCRKPHEVYTPNKILVGGAAILKRVQSNGYLDTTFSASSGGDIIDIELQPDGKILFSGSIQLNSTYIKGFGLVNSDRSIDNTFLGSQMDLTGNTQDIQLQTDGKIIAKGSFTELNRTNVNRIVRLNVDGSLDTTFNPKIDALATQQDGKIIIGG